MHMLDVAISTAVVSKLCTDYAAQMTTHEFDVPFLQKFEALGYISVS